FSDSRNQDLGRTKASFARRSEASRGAPRSRSPWTIIEVLGAWGEASLGLPSWRRSESEAAGSSYTGGCGGQKRALARDAPHLDGRARRQDQDKGRLG